VAQREARVIDLYRVWARVIAFRNRLIHGYWSIDLHLV
jgi:uncharacterized protein YutE (UPF0331/DUF86 family)